MGASASEIIQMYPEKSGPLVTGEHITATLDRVIADLTSYYEYDRLVDIIVNILTGFGNADLRHVAGRADRAIIMRRVAESVSLEIIRIPWNCRDLPFSGEIRKIFRSVHGDIKYNNFCFGEIGHVCDGVLKTVCCLDYEEVRKVIESQQKIIMWQNERIRHLELSPGPEYLAAENRFDVACGRERRNRSESI